MPPGGVVLLKDRVALMVVWRPPVLPSGRWEPRHPFGTADAAGNVAKTAAIGAAAGAAGGAVRGRAGRGAATGAAAAGAGATMREVFRSRQPDSVTKGYVDRCLRERGYNVIGWE